MHRIRLIEVLVLSAVRLVELASLMLGLSLMGIHLRSSLPNRGTIIIITMRSYIQLTLHMALFIIIPLHVVERLEFKRVVLVSSLLRGSRLINLNRIKIVRTLPRKSVARRYRGVVRGIFLCRPGSLMPLHQLQLLLVSVVHQSVENVNFELILTFHGLCSTPPPVLFSIKFLNGPSVRSYFWVLPLVAIELWLLLLCYYRRHLGYLALVENLMLQIPVDFHIELIEL